MKEQKKKVTENMALFERLEGTYIRDGSGMYYPALQSSDVEAHYGKYGMLRKSYLKEHRKGMYASYVLSGALVVHLNQIDHLANERLDLLVEQMKKAEGVDEALKGRDWLKWLQATNGIVKQAEEIILAKIVYA